MKTDNVLVTPDHIVVGYVRAGTTSRELDGVLHQLQQAAYGAKAVLLLENSVRVESVRQGPVMLLRLPANLSIEGIQRIQQATESLEIPGVHILVVKENTKLEAVSEEAMERAGWVRRTPAMEEGPERT